MRGLRGELIFCFYFHISCLWLENPGHPDVGYMCDERRSGPLSDEWIENLLQPKFEHCLAKMRECEQLAQQARDPQSKALYQFLANQWRIIIDQLQGRADKDRR